MKTKDLLNRNDIAELLRCTVDVVRKNERRLGINKIWRPGKGGVKIVLNRRNILYRRRETLQALEQRGLCEVAK